MSPLFRDLLSTRLGLLLASNIVLALGKSSSGRYDILHGSRGESACTLQNNMAASKKCTTSTRRDILSSILVSDDVTSPVPSDCTCNKIFFNIWSACCYSSGNNTLPNFTQWTQQCTTSSVNVESSTAFSELPENLGIDVPSWARLAVPGNTTFDLQRAVTIAYSSNSFRWTTPQIILIIVVVVMAFLISGIVFLIYQRHQRKFSRGRSRLEWPLKGLKRLHLHTSHRVTTTIDKDESWKIDGPLAKQPFEDEFEEYPKTVSSSNSASEKGTHSFRIPIRSSVRLPWKRRPPHIRLVPATSCFRVDEVKSILPSVEGKQVVQELVNDDFDHVPMGDEETTSLITPSERATRDSQDVLLISRAGREFTLESRSENTISINSHIKIISPSVSSASPHNSMQPVSARPTLYVPMPPPPPSHAAPAPPIIPRGLRSTERPSGSNSLTYFQPPPFLSPIKESSPTQSSSSSNASLRRSRAIRRSNSESISSNPNPGILTASPPSYFDLHRTASSSSDHSLADMYMEVNATDRIDHGPSPLDSDASNPSYYHNSTAQRPVRMNPVRVLPLRSTTDPAAFFPGPVRGAGYRNRGYTRWGEPF